MALLASSSSAQRRAGGAAPTRRADAWGRWRSRAVATSGRAYAQPVPDDVTIVCEVEPATRPDLMRVRHQVAAMSNVATSFLIPDNHIGRATVSSVAVAHEVEQMGGRSIACLNARDRNLLGFKRDLLTAAAYGVDASGLAAPFAERAETTDDEARSRARFAAYLDALERLIVAVDELPTT